MFTRDGIMIGQNTWLYVGMTILVLIAVVGHGVLFVWIWRKSREAAPPPGLDASQSDPSQSDLGQPSQDLHAQAPDDPAPSELEPQNLGLLARGVKAGQDVERTEADGR